MIREKPAFPDAATGETPGKDPLLILRSGMQVNW